MQKPLNGWEGTFLTPKCRSPEDAISKPGENADTSVTNSWSRTHEIPNLMIADGGVFASNPHKNPTLTIMALAWRGAAQMR